MATAFCFVERVRPRRSGLAGVWEPCQHRLTPVCHDVIAAWLIGAHIACTCRQQCQELVQSERCLMGMSANRGLLAQPALLIPLAEVGSVEFARAAGTSSTFDLLLHARDGAMHEVPLALSTWDFAAARALKRLCIAFVSCIDPFSAAKCCSMDSPLIVNPFMCEQEHLHEAL